MTPRSPADDRPSTPFACCAGGAWLPVADLGSAESVDFALGRCAACGRRWMHLWSPFAPVARYVAVGDRDAAALQAMRAGPARKRALADWFAAR